MHIKLGTDLKTAMFSELLSFSDIREQFSLRAWRAYSCARVLKNVTALFTKTLKLNLR